MFICGHESFTIHMAPFCILCGHDSYISYTHVGSTLYLLGDHLYMDMYVPKIKLFDIFNFFRVLLFEAMILVSSVSSTP